MKEASKLVSIHTHYPLTVTPTSGIARARLQ